MRVSLTNLGENPRVLYDQRNAPVLIGIGKSVDADISESVLEGLEKFKETETLIIAEPGEGKVPDELRRIVDLLSVIDFERYDVLLRQMHTISAPDSNLEIRPTRAAMRLRLRTMIDDYIAKLSLANRRQQIRDDVDPKKLESEEKAAAEKNTDEPASKPGQVRQQRNRNR
jgi:hypothetical protein